MDVSDVSSIANLAATQATQTTKQAMGAAMLRKNLDAQQNEAAQLMKLLEGKGQNLDIRV